MEPLRDDVSLDDLLDLSDVLHNEILEFLQGVHPYPGERNRIALVACGVALEHALSLRMLVRTRCLTSALAMMRLQFEAITRSVWVLYAASEREADTLSSPLTLDAEKAAKKLPMFSALLDQVIEKAPDQASRMLMNFKEINWHALNSFIHSGIHPLTRYSEGYPIALIQSAIRNSNGLNVMALQLGVVLSGNPSNTGLVRRTQEMFHQILPGLISPLD